MIFIILLFSLITSFKSIILSEFYSNFLMFSLYPLELALLSFNNSFSDIVIKWILNGWFSQENEIEYIKNVQEYNDYVIMISWAVTFLLFNIYIFLKYRKKLTKYIYKSYMLKFLIINYLSLYLWSFNILLNFNKIEYFVINLINVFIFNFITFWFPGILFNFIYGEKMYIYRKKYDFIIKNYNPRYKYFTLILQAFKSLEFIYMIIYNEYYNVGNYILLSINFFNIFIYFISKDIFIYKKLNYYLIILHLQSILLIILSIVDYLFEYNYIIKYCFLGIYIFFFSYFNYKRYKIIKEHNHNLNRLDVFSSNSVEMNIII